MDLVVFFCCQSSTIQLFLEMRAHPIDFGITRQSDLCQQVSHGFLVILFTNHHDDQCLLCYRTTTALPTLLICYKHGMLHSYNIKIVLHSHVSCFSLSNRFFRSYHFQILNDALGFFPEFLNMFFMIYLL